MSDQLEQDKNNATAFYDLTFNQNRPAKAIEGYAGDEYIQPNPAVADGEQAFIGSFESVGRDYPGTRVEFKRSVAEGNYVVLHGHQVWPGDHEYAGIDTFRFDDLGQVVEHRDVLQIVPEVSENDTTML